MHVCAVCRALVLQETAKLDAFNVLRQLQEGNWDLAAVNLSRESELGELRNHIAIVRYIAVTEPPLPPPPPQHTPPSPTSTPTHLMEVVAKFCTVRHCKKGEVYNDVNSAE